MGVVPAVLKRLGSTNNLTLEIRRPGDEYWQASLVSAGHYHCAS